MTQHRGSAFRPLAITEIRLRLAEDPAGDLIAYGSCVIDGAIIVNNIQVRRGRDGIVLVYPSTNSSSGVRHYTFHPITRAAGDALRDAFIGQLRRLAGLPPETSPEPR